MSLKETTLRAARDIHGHRRLFQVVAGCLFVIGVAAIVSPHVATLATEIVVGVLLLAVGAVQFIAGVRMTGAARMLGQMAIGVITTVCGLYMLIDPLDGDIALTLVLAIWFLVTGGLWIWVGVAHRQAGLRWVLTSGALSLAFGLLIILDLPSDIHWMVGLMVGVDLTFQGIALVAVIRAAEAYMQLGTPDAGPA